MCPVRMSKMETAMRIVLEFNEAFNRHDVPGMMKLMTDDCIFENTDPAPDGTVYSGKEVVTQFWQGFFRKSPHAHIEIEEIFGTRPALRHALEIHLDGKVRRAGTRPRGGYLQDQRGFDQREIVLRQRIARIFPSGHFCVIRLIHKNQTSA